MYDYDVVFIGSGHAVWHGAVFLRQMGKKVAMVEQDVLAGTCTNYGCDAKILLDSPFALADGLKRYQGIGVDSVPSIDWTKLMAYKKQVIGMLPVGMEAIFAQMGIPVLRGHGSLVDAHTVQAGDTAVTAEYIVIGTGEHPSRRDIPGKEYIHDSREFLDLDVFPKRVAFIGAGIISLEFASIAASVADEVSVIFRSDRVLRMYPKKYVDKAVAKMEAEGVRFIPNTNAAKVEKIDGGLRMTFENGQTLDADYIVEATGRVPNVDGLGLDEAGVEYSKRGIKVDGFMRTSVPNIYASGDVVDKTVPKLTPTATFESNYIAAHILGMMPAPIAYPVVPNLVFTLPRIAQVGVSLDEAEAKPEEYRIATVPYGQTMLFQAKNEIDQEFSFIFNKENDLVGAAIYGSDAGMMIDLITLVLNKKMTALELNSMIFAFPTESYGLLSALMPLLK